jgi:hypothetical protein
LLFHRPGNPNAMTGALERTGRKTAAAYAPGGGRPLRGYLAVMGVYGGIVGALAGLARLTGRRPPDRVTPADVAVLGLATHKLSRLLTKDAVTSPLRAPFTRYAEPAGEGELNEEVRGTGAQHAVGELITCPFCAGVWIATGLSAGLVFAPRLTRLVAAAASAVAVSDFLHLGYDVAKRAATR